MNFERIRRLVGGCGLIAMLVWLLAGCGGGSSSSSVTTASHMTVNGTVSGFGSVIIDGVEYDDSNATVSIGSNPAAPSAATLADLKLGMRVQAQVTDGKLSDVVVQATLVGAVSAVDVAGSSFMVNSQRVKVGASGATPTVFDGLGGLSDLVVADLVEVHGTLDSDKSIVATRVERKPKTLSAAGVRAEGVLSSLDVGGKTFKINDLTVSYASASVLPSGTALANGQFVRAFAASAPSGGVFDASVVSVVSLLGPDGSAAGIGGRITSFNSVSDFVVSDVKVDASAATIDNGSAADLALGVAVGAEGTVNNGTLKASKLRIFKVPSDAHASLAGLVTDFVSASSFKVRGTVVDASGASFSGGTVADLGNGANVIVQGAASGDVFKASQVTFMKMPSGAVKLRGEVRDYDSSAPTFHLLGMSAKLAGDVTYVNGSASDLANGKRVEVTGTVGSDGVVTVTKLEFLSDAASPVTVIGGRISDVTAGDFKLSGITVQFTSSTVIVGGTATDLVNGTLVLVKGSADPAKKTLVATSIEIQKDDNPAVSVHLMGAVTKFESKASFRVAGQLVDASDASFVDSTDADLANGKVVEVDGVLGKLGEAPVVKASKVRVL